VHALDIQVVVVIHPGKQAVADHVKSKLPDAAVETVLFNNKYREWPGSVFSAQEYFSDFNLVLMPDSFLSLSDNNRLLCPEGKSIGCHTLTCLMHSNVTFGCVCLHKSLLLPALGALHVNEAGYVTDFKDKPARKLNRFNGFWGCYGFRKKSAEDVYRFLIQSVTRRSVRITEQPFSPVTAFPLTGYMDLGTWSAIHEFREKFTFQLSTFNMELCL